MTARHATSRTAVYAGAALIGFAGNSLLARVALRPSLIDPLAFTAVRLCSGAATLVLLAWVLRGLRPAFTRWTPAVALFAYALAFSLAYVRLPVGVGALILFGAVQVTMIGWGMLRGERPATTTWLGVPGGFWGLGA